MKENDKLGNQNTNLALQLSNRLLSSNYFFFSITSRTPQPAQI